jgi:hypothetical protein
VHIPKEFLKNNIPDLKYLLIHVMKIPRLYFDTSVFGGVYDIEFIEITKEVNQLAEKYIQEKVVGETSMDD